MTRLLLVLAAAAFLSASGCADDRPNKQNQSGEPEVTLKVGSPAPKLKVTKWLKGDAVPAFDTGKVYVVEFWATWCGPCISAMPHISQLQEEYRDKGLTVIGVTTRDDNNTEEKVNEFMKNRGEIMRYTSAWCEDEGTSDAFLKAAGRNGIPCSFVVDQRGNIAFIGHPLILDEVLPKVFDGSWKGKADAEAAEKNFEDFFGMINKASRNPTEGIKLFQDAEKKSPKLAALFGDQKIMLLMRNKQGAEAEALFQEVRSKASKNKDAGKLLSLSRVWSSAENNPDKRNIKWAVETVEEAQKLAGPKDLSSLLTAAQVYDAAGDKAKAAEYADKAVAASPDEYKDQVKKMTEKFKK